MKVGIVQFKPDSLKLKKAAETFNLTYASAFQHTDKDAYILKNNKKLSEKFQLDITAAKKFFENCTKVIDEFFN